MKDIAPILAVLTVIMIGVTVGYAIWLFNDLTQRLEHLKSLAANLKAIRARGYGIGRDVARHVVAGTRHEQHVVRLGAKRGGGGGRMIKVSDNGNGWASADALGTVNEGLSQRVRSRDAENEAARVLHAEATDYNSRLRSIPACWVGPAMGFRPWTFGRTRQKSNHR